MPLGLVIWGSLSRTFREKYHSAESSCSSLEKAKDKAGSPLPPHTSPRRPSLAQPCWVLEGSGGGAEGAPQG